MANSHPSRFRPAMPVIMGFLLCCIGCMNDAATWDYDTTEMPAARPYVSPRRPTYQPRQRDDSDTVEDADTDNSRPSKWRKKTVRRYC